MVKASAGGGGKGMKVAESPDELQETLNICRREAMVNFGNDALYMEKYLQHPRHIEVQVMGDGHGKVLHFGERDCSLQRRHQKVLEEAPSPALDQTAATLLARRSPKRSPQSTTGAPVPSNSYTKTASSISSR